MRLRFGLLGMVVMAACMGQHCGSPSFVENEPDLPEQVLGDAPPDPPAWDDDFVHDDGQADDEPLSPVESDLDLSGPDVFILASADSGPVPLHVDFVAAVADNTVLSGTYEWDFGDGGTGMGSGVSHTYRLPGTYFVSLCLTLSSGAVSCSQLEITASEPDKVKISGVVEDESGAGLPQILVVAEGTGASAGMNTSATTVDDGSYTFEVSYGWTGTVTPESEEYTFEPSSVTYTEVTADEEETKIKGNRPPHAGVGGPPSHAKPGKIEVTPSSGLSSSGEVGGPFTPSYLEYTLSNTGGEAITWSASSTKSWVRLSKTSGSLAAGASDTVTVEITSGAKTLPPGHYNDGVTFTNTTNGEGTTTHDVSLDVEETPAGALAVTPSGGLSSSGTQGGPFSPGSVSFTLTNSGGSSINWTAGKTQSWVSLSKTSGTLAAGATDTVTVTLNSGANNLAVGSHGDTVTFTNATNGAGTTTRSVSLTVEEVPQGALAVTPSGGLSSSGTQGGPFSPGSQTYTLSNPGGSSINWTVTRSQSWVGLSKTSGTLAAGASDTVNVTINSGANSLASGSHSDTITFANTTNGGGSTTRAVSLTVDPLPGVLAVTPLNGLSSSGTEGGPFSPGSQTYTVSNTGGSSINWTVTRSQSWVGLSKSSGTLAAGASDTVNVTINSGANSLASGSHSDTITFANTTNGGGSTTRSVSLAVDPLPDDGEEPDLLVKFSDLPAGSDPPDWYDTGANNSMVQNNSLFKVFSVGGTSVFGTTSTSTNIHSHYVGSGSAGWTAYRLSGRMRIDDGGAGIGVTFLSDYPNSDTYYRLRRSRDGDSLVISPHPDNVVTMSGGIQDSGVVPVANVWYHYIVEVEAGATRTDIRAKVWPEGSAEPSSWQVDCFDDSSNRIVAGTFGVWSMGSGSKFWGDISVTSLTAEPPTTPTAATPVISPNGGTHTGSVQVSLASETPGATIRYTTNGSEPTSSSTAYSAPLTLSTSATVKARAFADGHEPSEVASAGFTVNPAGDDCSDSTATWQNFPMASQTGSFTAEFEAVPGQADMDGVIGLSSGAGTWYTNFAVMVRFNASGYIDARNGSAYAAGASIPYSAGTRYRFRVVVDVPARTYTVYVRPAGSAEQLLAANFAFRTEQNSVTSLNNWGLIAEIGSLKACDFALSGAPLTASAGPDVTILSGSSNTLNGSASGGTAPYTYAWSPSTGLSSTSVAQPTTSPTATTVYTLTVTDAQSDTATDTVTVTVAQPVTLSGRVVDEDGAGMAGVTISGLPGSPVTDANGNYAVTTASGFSGTATPIRSGYTFTPASRSYSNVTANQANQNYTGAEQPIDETYASSISQYGITWTFDKPYRVGQFVNGDWWVVGPIILQRIDVIPVGSNPSTPTGGRNGFVLNPATGPGTDGKPKRTHAYDSRAAGYDASLQPVLPSQVGVNSSIVATISLGSEADTTSSGAEKLKTAAVLTVLESAPPVGSFRPPYVGLEKPVYSSHDLRRDLLPTLPPVASTPTISSLASRFQRPWLDHQTAWSGKAIHPLDNMPGYGANMVSTVGSGSLRLMLNDSVEEKEPLLINYVQLGIDLYGMVQNGQLWPADGGHASGRKWPIIFAGIMLNDSGMLSIGHRTFPFYHFVPNGPYPHGFGEDCQTFYDSNGKPMYGIRHCEGNNDSNYQYCCTSRPWIGQTLAARLLNATHLWNHDAYFDYVDWWVNNYCPSNYESPFCGNYGSSFNENMWTAYRMWSD